MAADLFMKYKCTYCQEDIKVLGIRCVECVEFDLCMQCFACGAESGAHKNNHSYQFVDTGNFSVFGKDGWSAREEVRLLDAIEQYGFGNWEDISKHIETRTPEEAREEYVSRYIEGNIGKATWATASNNRNRPKDHTCVDNGPLSPSLTARLPPLDITPEEAIQLGYMPHRDDYEKEYENDAETLVSQLFVNSVEDEDTDIALKLAHVDMFTRNLRERARRKRVVRDFQLVGQFFAQQRKEKQGVTPSKKKVGKEEKESAEKEQMLVFSQFYTSQEQEQFLQNIQKERELKFRTKELMRYRRNGLTRHEECTEYEKARILRERLKEKKSGSSGALPSHLSTAIKTEEKSVVESLSSQEKKFTLPPVLTQSGQRDPNSQNTLDINKNKQKLLSRKELQLCSSLKMKPSYYIAIKTVLLKDQLMMRKGVPMPLQIPEGLDLEDWQKISKFLVDSGWMPTR